MAEVQPGTPETSQLPADLSLHEAADLFASYRTAPQELGPSATGIAESVIEETPDQDQPVDVDEIVDVEAESSEDGSLEESTEETTEEPESLADSEDDQPEDLEAEAEFYEINGEEVSLETINEWRKGGMRQDDYQRKTQVLAQQTQVVSDLEKNLNQFAHATTQMSKARLSKIEGAIAQYNTVDWAKLANEDQQKYTVHKAQYDQLKAQYAKEQREFNGFVQGFNQASAEVIAKKAEAAYPEIKQRIPGWNAAHYNSLRELCVKTGADPEQVNNLTDPWAWVLIDLANTYLNGKSMKTGKRKIRRPTKTLKAKAPVTPIDKDARSAKDGLDAIRKSSGSVKDQMDAGAALLKARRGQRKR